MKGKITSALVAALTLAGIAGAGAANVHYKPPSSQPSFNDKGLVLNAAGALAGLGNQDIKINLEAKGNPTASCTNPSGANQPPGRNPAPVTLTGFQSIPASEVKNGNVAFSVTTSAPTTPIAGAPDCPNPQWTEKITDVAFTSATITVEQPVGTVALTSDCTMTPATKNGPVPARQVQCKTS